MILTKDDKEHIKVMGDAWANALAVATFTVRQNSKLVGLDKIRSSLALVAALKATGAPGREIFIFPSSAGPPSRDIVEIAERAFSDAVDAVQKVLQKESANLED